MPFERLTKLCKTHGVLSCIDAAHGIGHLPLNIQTLDPDFLMSNCHKWLYVPRPCAFLYVPARNQHLLRATIPVGFKFVALPDKPSFAANFASVGTLDDTPYLCVKAALEWRSKLTWNGKNGDEAIMGYLSNLARQGGKEVATILQTEILDNDERTLTDCGLVNIRLPVSITALKDTEPARVGAWIQRTMTVHFETAVVVFVYAGALWVRLSAQVYVTLKDFERAAGFLVEVCERADREEWKAG